MYQRFIKAVVVPLFLLLLPYFAMQLTNHIKWSTFDFFVMTLLLLYTELAVGIFNSPFAGD